MQRPLSIVSIVSTLLLLVACGRTEPLPRVAPESLRFALIPTHDEVPRELRVTLDVPADWRRSGGGFVRTFSSGVGDGVVYGELSVELAVLRNDDPAEIPALLAKDLETVRQRYDLRDSAVQVQPAVTPGVTSYAFDRGVVHNRVIAKVVSPAHGFVLFCRVESSSGQSAVFGDLLYEACKAAKLELVATILPAELATAQRAKLAQCPPATNVVFTRSERGQQSPGPTAFGPVLAARAFATSGDKLEIDLANYVHDVWKAGAKPAEEGQVRLAFEVSPSTDKHVIDGRYPVGARSFVASSQARLLTGGDWSRIELAVDDSNGAEIVARTSDKVCGRYVFSDGHHTVRGTFVLDLLVGRPVR